MSKIHYFQRYSTKENTVTNNTLQLLARIYGQSATKLDVLLSELLKLEEGLGVGIEIEQQQKSAASIPDGIIIQRSFKVVLEAKLGSHFDMQQLLNHCDAFDGEKLKVLVLLTSTPLSESDLADAVNRVATKDKSIIFRSVTYAEICESLSGFFKEFEGDITNIVDDYITYCHEAGLISGAAHYMRVVPTGESFDLNKKYAMYFDPISRGYSQHAYIGFYKNKSVRCMIKIHSIFEVDCENGKIKSKKCIFGENTEAFNQRIIDMVQEAYDDCKYEIETGHKFFCGDEAFDTDFRKITPYGIQGARFKDLRDFGVSDFTNTAAIAGILASKTWE